MKVNDILNDERFKGVCGELKFEHIQHIVDKNDKKRFEMREVDKEWYIKAVQGHTIQVTKEVFSNLQVEIKAMNW